jgi:hypothetical protein
MEVKISRDEKCPIHDLWDFQRRTISIILKIQLVTRFILNEGVKSNLNKRMNKTLLQDFGLSKSSEDFQKRITFRGPSQPQWPRMLMSFITDKEIQLWTEFL